MGVLAYAAGYVRLGAAGSALRGLEQAVQTLQEGFCAAKGLNQSGHVLGHEERVLPGVGLGVVVVYLAGVEGGKPAAVQACAHEAGGRVEHVAPVLRRAHVLFIILLPPEIFGDLRHAPVVISELECLGDAFVLVVTQHQAVAAEAFHAVFGPQRTRHHGLVRLLHVESGDAAGDCVGYDGSRIVAYHAVCLPAGQLPHRQLAVLFVNRYHGTDEVGAAFRLDLKQQRMLAPECVPGREYGVTLPSVGCVDLPVHAPVAAVGVGIKRRVDAGMIQRRIEAPLVLAVLPGAPELAQIRLPLRPGGFPEPVQARRILAHEVCAGAVFGHAGDCGAQGDPLAFESKARSTASVEQFAFGILGELDIEVQLLSEGPAAGNALAAHPAGAAVDGEVVQGVPVPEVDGYARRAAPEGVFVHRDPPPGGKAHAYAVV